VAEAGEVSSPPPFLLFFLKTDDYFTAAHHRHSELHRESRQNTSKAKTLKPFSFSRKTALVSQKKWPAAQLGAVPTVCRRGQ